MQKQKLGWYVVAVAGSLIGLYPIIYFLVDREFGLLSTKSPELLADLAWNLAFYVHIIFGGLSLLVGWPQFSAPWRSRRLQLHRNLGKVYVAAVLLSGLAGCFVALEATGGLVSSLGFGMLALLWLGTTLKGYADIRRGRVEAHRRMMVYSYAAAFAAVTLRIWLPILSAATGDFVAAYRAVAWLCWVPNLAFAWWYTRRLAGHPPAGN